TASSTPERVGVIALDQGALIASGHPALLTQFAASTTSLSVSPGEDPSVTNAGVTLISTVTSLAGGVPPTGTVSVENGGIAIVGCTNLPIPAQPTPSVSVTCRTSFGAAESPSQLSAVFAPSSDSLVIGSSSQSQDLVTDRDATFTTLSSASTTAS